MSSLNIEHKRLFIHLPKCAGTSMEHFAWNRGSGHKTISDYSREINLDEYFKWCFVRNPWDRILSAYEDCHELHETITSFEMFINTIYIHKNSFNVPEIRFSSLPSLGLPVGRIHFFPLAKQIKHKGEVKIDFIGKYENMEEDWKNVLNIMNIPYEPLPHLNSRKKKKNKKNSYYKDVYTPELITKVEELYKEDIDLFNYSY